MYINNKKQHKKITQIIQYLISPVFLPLPDTAYAITSTDLLNFIQAGSFD